MREVRKPPAHVLIGHAYFDIQFDPHLNEDSEAVGLTGPETQRILIDPKLGPDVERETVLHECLHGIYFQAGLRLEQWSRDKIEEKIIWSIAPRLLSLLKDNMELVEYLTESIQ